MYVSYVKRRYSQTDHIKHTCTEIARPPTHPPTHPSIHLSIPAHPVSCSFSSCFFFFFGNQRLVMACGLVCLSAFSAPGLCFCIVPLEAQKVGTFCGIYMDTKLSLKFRSIACWTTLSSTIWDTCIRYSRAKRSLQFGPKVFVIGCSFSWGYDTQHVHVQYEMLHMPLFGEISSIRPVPNYRSDRGYKLRQVRSDFKRRSRTRSRWYCIISYTRCVSGYSVYNMTSVFAL